MTSENTAELGHDDSKMTLDVYAQLEQRVDRSHGTSFDALIRDVRRQTISALQTTSREVWDRQWDRETPKSLQGTFQAPS
jgi:hypothetical protein